MVKHRLHCRKHDGDQVPTMPVSARWIMSQPAFVLGAADARAGRGTHRDYDLWDTNGQWGYERGRSLGHAHTAACPTATCRQDHVRSIGVVQVLPLTDIPPHRWRQFLSDCNNFLTGGENWAGRAAELGWNAASLFGCRRARPLAHPGGAGLLWAIQGGRPSGPSSRASWWCRSVMGHPGR